MEDFSDGDSWTYTCLFGLFDLSKWLVLSVNCEVYFVKLSYSM